MYVIAPRENDILHRYFILLLTNVSLTLHVLYIFGVQLIK